MTATATPPEAKPVKLPEIVEPDEKVLDITDLAPSRRRVKVPTKDHPLGEQFEIRLLEDFGVAEQQQILAWSRRYDALYNREADEPDLTPTQADQLRFCLNSMFEEILDAPKAVKSKMPDSVRQRVVRLFSIAPMLTQQERILKEQQASVFGLLVSKGLITQEKLDEVAAEAEALQTSTSEN